MNNNVKDILDAFQNRNYQTSLRLISEFKRKLKKKKMMNLESDAIEVINIVHLGTLAGLGQLHKANQLLMTQLKPEQTSPVNVFLFLTVCYMARSPNLCNYIEKLGEVEKKMNRFQILNRQFDALSRYFFQQGRDTKNIDNFLVHCYLLYLKELNSHHMISFSRNKIVHENKNMNFKFVNLFLSEFMKMQDVKMPSQAHLFKRTKAAKLLQLKILIHEGQAKAARDKFASIKATLKLQIFECLRSIRQMSQQTDINVSFWCKQMLQIFQRNYNFQQYTPIYDYSNEFLTYYIDKAKQQKMQLFTKQPVVITEEQVYKFSENTQDLLSNYYNSLWTELDMKVNNEQKYKSNDYYKICVKNLILQLLRICKLGNHGAKINELLRVYKRYFHHTLTFGDQVGEYLQDNETVEDSFRQLSLQKSRNAKQDELTWKITLERIYPSHRQLKAPTLEQMLQIWHNYAKQYKVNVEQVQKSKKLQKGQRYISDQFIVLAADSVKLFTQSSTSNLNDKQRQDCYFYILKLLSEAQQKSPYNTDLRCRCIFFRDKLCHNDAVFHNLEIMDTKSVQLQTLGAYFLKPMIRFRLYEQNETSLHKMLTFYQRVLSQTLQYAYKALQELSFDNLVENLCFNQNITNSYNYLILLYVLYLQHRREGEACYFLKQIINKVNNSHNSLSLNCDFKIMRSKFISNSPSQELEYIDLYGCLNSPDLLRNQCMVKLQIHNLIHNQRNQEHEYEQQQVSFRCDWKPEEILDFSKFKFEDRQVKYSYQNNKDRLSEKQLSEQINHYNIITVIRIQVLELLDTLKVSDLNASTQTSAKIISKIEQFAAYMSGLSWRKQCKLITTSRMYFAELIQALESVQMLFKQKGKKKLENSGGKKKICENITHSLIDSVTTWVKWSPREKIEKQFLSAQLISDEQMLERVTVMTDKEYMSHYKILI